MPKKFHILFLVILLLGNLIFAAEGRVNIFTGDKNAEIYIDGDKVGQESVAKLPIQEGSHYLQVKKNGQVLKSQTFVISPDKTETVVVEDFVDFKTNVASRGAIDVEAMRVRETRGNIAFGMYGGSPASGLSLKWWPTERVGLQTIGYINNFNDNIDSRGGVRLLINLNESVYKGGTMTYYLALGTGRSMLRNNTDGEKNETYDLSELAVGMEFKLANFFGEEKTQEYKHVVIDENTSPVSVLITQFIISLGEGFFKFAHFDLEIGVERIFTVYHLADTEESSLHKVAAKFSGGYHIYF